jgi:hypothetical protein
LEVVLDENYFVNVFIKHKKKGFCISKVDSFDEEN